MEKTLPQTYLERVKRIEDATRLREPDRIPLMLSPHFFPTNYTGVSCREAMYDYDKLGASWKKYLLDFQPDSYPNPFHRIGLGHLAESLDSRQIKWPGHGVSSSSTYQFVEDEHMKADDYDSFLKDPSDYMLRTYLPLICRALEPLRLLPYFGEISYSRVLTMTAAFSQQEVVETLEILKKTGTEATKLLAMSRTFAGAMENLGFPTEYGAIASAPFDHIGNYFRGTKGIILDMYQRPGKLLEAIEKARIIITRAAISVAKRSGNPRVFIPLHRGADGFMSLQQFKTFYWPSLHKLILDLIREDLTPYVFFEGQYASRLEIIGDIPAGKAIYWFEHTDLFTVKKRIGSHVCIKGNVPASMLCTGSPQEIRNYCKKLIDEVGRSGGFIMDGAIGIPDEAKAENVKALVDCTREHGSYH